MFQECIKHHRWNGIPLPGVRTGVVVAAIWILVIAEVPDQRRGLPRVLVELSGGLRALACSPRAAQIAWIGFSGKIGCTEWGSDWSKTTILSSNSHSAPAALAFSAAGEDLALGFYDGSVEILDTNSWHLRRRLETKGEPVRCVRFSPDGKVVATGSADGSIWLWNTRTGRLCTTLRGHQASMSGLGFDSQGRELASSDVMGRVLIWNWRQSLPIGEFKPTGLVPGEPTTTLVLALSDDWLAFATEHLPLTYFNRQRGNCSETSSLRAEAIASMALSPEGASLITGNRNGTIDLWDARGKVHQSRRAGHGGAVSQLAFTADGRLVTAEDDGPLEIWTPGEF